MNFYYGFNLILQCIFVGLGVKYIYRTSYLFRRVLLLSCFWQ